MYIIRSYIKERHFLLFIYFFNLSTRKKELISTATTTKWHNTIDNDIYNINCNEPNGKYNRKNMKENLKKKENKL